jgi:hypothetical protein
MTLVKICVLSFFEHMRESWDGLIYLYPVRHACLQLIQQVRTSLSWVRIECGFVKPS